MAVAVAITNVDFTMNRIVVDGTLTLTGNYGTGGSHGDALSLQSDLIKSQSVPTVVEIYEAPASGTAATGYNFLYTPGTTLANGALQILGTGAAAGGGAQEYAQGTAYSGPLLAAVLYFKAWFPSFV